MMLESWLYYCITLMWWAVDRCEGVSNCNGGNVDTWRCNGVSNIVLCSFVGIDCLAGGIRLTLKTYMSLLYLMANVQVAGG